MGSAFLLWYDFHQWFLVLKYCFMQQEEGNDPDIVFADCVALAILLKLIIFYTKFTVSLCHFIEVHLWCVIPSSHFNLFQPEFFCFFLLYFLCSWIQQCSLKISILSQRVIVFSSYWIAQDKMKVLFVFVTLVGLAA